MSEEDPQHRKLAIALEYERGSRQAPRVTAKGYGHVAEAIVALARENDVLIETNPVLADALAGVELDQTIPIELYEAVAEVIGLVLRARNRLGSDQDAISK